MTLPAGWEARTDPQSGRTYYQNNLTKATQWEPPGAPPPPPPPHAGYAGIPGNPGASAGADYLLRGLQATNRSRSFWQLVRLLTIAHSARALHARNGAYISHVGAVTTGCYRAHAPDLPSVGRGDIFDRVLCGRGSRSAEKVHPCADMGRGHAHKSMDMQGLLGFESLHTDSKLGSQVHERFCCYQFLAVVVH